jgi:hypothetical protein
VALLLVPAMETLDGGVRASAQADAAAANYQSLRAKMEEVLAEPVARLDAAAQLAGGATVPTRYSDPASAGAAQRLVMISRYDADNADADGNPFTGTDQGLMWIEVRIVDQPQRLVSLVAW